MVHDLMGYSEYEEHGYDSLARRWWNGLDVEFWVASRRVLLRQASKLQVVNCSVKFARFLRHH